MSLHYLIGDATKPCVFPAIIAHITNDEGGWGKGFVLALEAAFPGVRARWKRINQTLGHFWLDEEGAGVGFAHICAQSGYLSVYNPEPLNYLVLESGLAWLGHRVWQMNQKDPRYPISVHMPRIGTGLAGGRWETIEPFIVKELVGRGVEVYVYDLEKK